MPGKIPHSPQRKEDTIGLVIERERATHELDCLRWFELYLSLLWINYLLTVKRPLHFQIFCEQLNWRAIWKVVLLRRSRCAASTRHQRIFRIGAMSNRPSYSGNHSGESALQTRLQPRGGKPLRFEQLARITPNWNPQRRQKEAVCQHKLSIGHCCLWQRNRWLPSHQLWNMVVAIGNKKKYLLLFL